MGFSGQTVSQKYWASTKFGKLRMLNPIDISPGSSTKPVEWVCDCGKTVKKAVFFISTGRQTSCGKCNFFGPDYWSSAKFGKLRMEVPIEVHKGSSKRVTWLCDCGRNTKIPVSIVTNGNTSSCGKCDWKKSEYWVSAKFGKLRMEIPVDIHVRSDMRVSWICDCDKKTLVSVRRVTEGTTSSCGRCNWEEDKYWASTKFGKLRMKFPTHLAKHSERRVEWICDCGRETVATVHHVSSGATTSCNKCSWKTEDYWASTSFGKLRMCNPFEIGIGSQKKVQWSCTCGGSIKAPVVQVTSGGLSSCTKCYSRALEWFESNRSWLVNSSLPIYPSQVPPGWLTFKHVVLRSKDKIQALCGACKNPYSPIWKDLRVGKSLTCGCTAFRVSKPNKEIYEFVKSIDPGTEIEKKVGNFSFDVHAPSRRLLIEHNGLRWHSYSKSKDIDARKYWSAVDLGYEYMLIFEDEWREKRSRMEGILCNRLGSSSCTSLRPSACVITKVDRPQADAFYDDWHYIGACKSPVNYGVFYDGKLIGCMSFKRPTRQSKHDWELIRITSDARYRVHGIWNKLLKQFIAEYHPTSIVTFSDNRLFSGGLYLKLGFSLDGHVRPDYYWVRGMRRFHKSGLRKTADEVKTGLTESVLRKDQGYRKIWDLGKKRWVYKP